MALDENNRAHLGKLYIHVRLKETFALLRRNLHYLRFHCREQLRLTAHFTDKRLYYETRLRNERNRYNI